jgi:hypothetical protein
MLQEQSHPAKPDGHPLSPGDAFTVFQSSVVFITVLTRPIDSSRFKANLVI